MEKIVLDTHAAAALFFDEAGADKVEKTIVKVLKSGGSIVMSAVNYGELFYAVLKKEGHSSALKAMHMLDTIPVDIMNVDKNMALLAGGYKAENKMSYADCFAAAAAKVLNAAIVTGDPEFKEVEREIKIIWI